MPDQSRSSPESENCFQSESGNGAVVECRGEKQLLLAGALLVFFALLTGFVYGPPLVFQKMSMAETVAGFVFVFSNVGVLLATAGYFFGQGLCVRLVADEKGLRWRTFRVWRSVSWAEVEDFHLDVTTPSVHTIITPLAPLRIVWKLTNLEDFYAVVEARACDGKKKWNLKGVLLAPGEERNYVLDEARLRFKYVFPIALLVCAVGGTGWAAYQLLFGKVPASALSEYWMVATGFPISLLLLPVPLLQQRYENLAARAHQGQVIRVNATGIRSEVGSSVVALSWNDVTRFEELRDHRIGRLSRYILEGAGGQINFVPAVLKHDGLAPLDRVVEQILPSGVERVLTEVGGRRASWRRN